MALLFLVGSDKANAQQQWPQGWVTRVLLRYLPQHRWRCHTWWQGGCWLTLWPCLGDEAAGPVSGLCVLSSCQVVADVQGPLSLVALCSASPALWENTLSPELAARPPCHCSPAPAPAGFTELLTPPESSAAL